MPRSSASRRTAARSSTDRWRFPAATGSSMPWIRRAARFHCTRRRRSNHRNKGGVARTLFHAPYVHHRIAAPRTPSLREIFCFTGGDTAQTVADGDVLLGKGVGPPKGPHGDVLRRPWPDARQFGKTRNACI